MYVTCLFKSKQQIILFKSYCFYIYFFILVIFGKQNKIQWKELEMP